MLAVLSAAAPMLWYSAVWWMNKRELGDQGLSRLAVPGAAASMLLSNDEGEDEQGGLHRQVGSAFCRCFSVLWCSLFWISGDHD